MYTVPDTNNVCSVYFAASTFRGVHRTIKAFRLIPNTAVVPVLARVEDIMWCGVAEGGERKSKSENKAEVLHWIGLESRGEIWLF